jgi:formate dehydrogenase subunit gamma
MNPAFIHQQVAKIIEQHRLRPGALLPVLHGIQDELGFIPSESVIQISLALNLSRAEVHGVITFYHHFRTTPPAKHSVQVCRAEACQSMGGENLAEHVAQRIDERAAGSYDVHPVYCLGLCANAPALMIDEVLHARVTPEKFDRLINALGAHS